MAKFTRTVGWGEALLLEVHYRSPGLNPLVTAINEAVGGMGVRNTYAKLYNYVQPPTAADPKDYFRAWLVLTALGQNPAEWGISDDAVPAGYDLERVRRLVTVWVGWFSETAA